MENHGLEGKELMSELEYVGAEARKTIGSLVTAFVVAGVTVGLLRAAIV